MLMVSKVLGLLPSSSCVFLELYHWLLHVVGLVPGRLLVLLCDLTHRIRFYPILFWLENYSPCYSPSYSMGAVSLWVVYLGLLLCCQVVLLAFSGLLVRLSSS